MALSAAKAEVGSAMPSLSNWGFEGIWSGRGTEGMVRWIPASLGMEVPVGAISEREPPWCGLGILVFFCGVLRVVEMYM